MMSPFEFKVRVFYEDTDAGGIVYHSNYLRFCERARTEWLRSLGVEQYTLLQQNLAFVVRAVQVDFHAPAKLDDLLLVQTMVKRHRRICLRFEQKIYCDQRLLVTTSCEVVSVDIQRYRPVPIHKDLLEIFNLTD